MFPLPLLTLLMYVHCPVFVTKQSSNSKKVYLQKFNLYSLITDIIFIFNGERLHISPVLGEDGHCGTLSFQHTDRGFTNQGQ